jgi:CTP synthase
MLCDDGAETDLDLGHYERFLNVPTSQQTMLLQEEYIFRLLKRKKRRISWENGPSGSSYYQ